MEQLIDGDLAANNGGWASSISLFEGCQADRCPSLLDGNGPLASVFTL